MGRIGLHGCRCGEQWSGIVTGPRWPRRGDPVAEDLSFLAVRSGFGASWLTRCCDGDGFSCGCGSKLADEIIIWKLPKALGLAGSAFCAEDVEAVQTLVEVRVDGGKMVRAVRLVADMEVGSS